MSSSSTSAWLGPYPKPPPKPRPYSRLQLTPKAQGATGSVVARITEAIIATTPPDRLNAPLPTERRPPEVPLELWTEGAAYVMTGGALRSRSTSSSSSCRMLPPKSSGIPPLRSGCEIPPPKALTTPSSKSIHQARVRGTPSGSHTISTPTHMDEMGRYVYSWPTDSKYIGWWRTSYVLENSWWPPVPPPAHIILAKMQQPATQTHHRAPIIDVHPKVLQECREPPTKFGG